MVGKRPGSRGQMLLPYTTLFRSQGRRQESVVRKILLEVLQDLDRLSRPSGHPQREGELELEGRQEDRKSTRLNSSHITTSYAVFCLKKKRTANRRLGRSSARHSG